jgi:hypothetical protein
MDSEPEALSTAEATKYAKSDCTANHLLILVQSHIHV